MMLRGLDRVPISLVVDFLANSTGRTVDTLYATLVHRLGLSAPFFKAGWGNLGVVDFAEAESLLRGWPPEHFDTQVDWKRKDEGVRHGTAYELLEGTFRTPCFGRIYDALPEESRCAHVQLLRPRGPWEGDCVVHLAGTGDHGFHRRMQLGAPLLEKGVATIALESPYYGKRRPPWQEGSKLCRVSDLLTLGRATIEESLYLLTWAKRAGFDRLGMCGFSMGGVHACMVAALYPQPVACVPLLAPRSAAVAFCHGALRDATAWQPLAAAADEAQMDVEATVLRAAQANLVTAAAERVLAACRAVTAGGADVTAAGEDRDIRPGGGGGSPSGVRSLQEDVAELRRLSAAAAVAPSEDGSSALGERRGGPSRATLAEQAASALGKAEDLLRWSLDLRALQLPRLPSSVPIPWAAPALKNPKPSSPPWAAAAQGACSAADAAAPGGGDSGVVGTHDCSGGDATGATAKRAAAAVLSAQQQQHGRAAAAAEKLTAVQRRSWAGWALAGQKGLAAGEREAARRRLDAVLETYTDVTRFPRPRRPDCAVIVGAHNDAYVSPASIRELAAHWPGSEVRWVPGGHVSAFLFQQGAFRSAITDSLGRLSQPQGARAEAVAEAA